MKLLFDQMLSPKLVARLSDAFPDSAHVQSFELDSSRDTAIWEFARQHGFVIVTKDSDYDDLSALRGWPPKVVRLLTGNGPYEPIVRLLLERRTVLEAFASGEPQGLLLLE